MEKHLLNSHENMTIKIFFTKKSENILIFYCCKDLLVLVPVPNLRVDRLCFIAQISKKKTNPQPHKTKKIPYRTHPTPDITV